MRPFCIFFTALCLTLFSLNVSADTDLNCRILTDGSGFIPGDTATISIALSNNLSTDINVDAYIARVSPDNTCAFYSPFGSFINADISDVSTWQALVTNFRLPAMAIPTTALLNEIFSVGSPAGTYSYYFLLSRGNSIDPIGDLLTFSYCSIVLFDSVGHGTEHSGTIDSNETWSPAGNPHIITGDLSIEGNAPEGAILTILPGVIVRFEENASIEIGAANKPGTLIAQADKDSNIIFTSNQTVNTKGWWEHIRFNEQAINCRMTYCVVEYGGGDDSWASHGNIVISAANNVEIENCIVVNSKTAGVAFPYGDGHATFSTNTITDNNTYGIDIFADQVRGINADNSVAGNALGGVYVEGDTVENDAVWHRLDSEYIVEEFKIASPNGTTLTIEPGATIKFVEDASIEVGDSDQPGKLVAEGSKDLPIIFTSNQTSKTKGWWHHIRFKENDFGSSLLHCKIEYGGGYDSWTSSANLVIYGAGNVTIDQCDISNSLTAGIAYPVSGDSLATITNCNMDNNETYGIKVFANQVRGIAGSNSVADNILGGIYVRTEIVKTDATWHKLDTPYILESVAVKSINSSGVVLTIEAGTELAFVKDALFEVGDDAELGTLTAKGTVEEPIVFTRKLPIGNWYGIKFNQYAYNCILDYCTVEYGGGYDSWSGGGNVVTSSESTDITNCTITNSKIYGVKVMYSGKPDLTGTSFSGNTNDDIYLYDEESGYKGKPVEPFTVGRNY